MPVIGSTGIARMGDVAEPGEQRRLAAIFAADMFGYSRLMETDERGTIARQKAHRAELIDPKITEHHGRIVKTTGDGMLVEFASVVDAVECAVAIQRAMLEREADVPNDRRIRYRVGINLGDIVVEGDDIFGDGVNIAARLEEMAEPGGLCISGTAYDHLKQKVNVGYEDLGELHVKNIENPVRVYRVLLGPEAVGSMIGEKHPSSMPRPFGTIAAIVLIAMLAAGGVLWWLEPWAPDVEPASLERMALPLPDKPSIAVLPFANLNDDPSQDFFSDGITSDIITDLSKFDDLMVIASNSTFRYKGKPTKVQQVAEELGVRYVLEGSVQRIGDQVRVNIQFVDAITGQHLWAERYDRELSDIFAVQDEITQKVVAILGVYEGRVAEADRARAKRKAATNLSAYELVLLAREIRHRFNKEDNAKSLELLQKAIGLDPHYARAYVELAWTHFQDSIQKFVDSPDVSATKAYDSAKKAIEFDDSFGEAYWVLGDIYTYLLEQPEKGVAEFERALALNPNHADIMADWGGWILPYLGRAEEGIAVVKKAMRLNPFHADWYNRALMAAYFTARRYEEAIAEAQSIEYHTFNSYVVLAASYAHAGRLEEARMEAAKIMELRPDFSISTVSKRLWLSQAEVEHAREGLRKAGIPE